MEFFTRSLPLAHGHSEILNWAVPRNSIDRWRFFSWGHNTPWSHALLSGLFRLTRFAHRRAVRLFTAFSRDEPVFHRVSPSSSRCTKVRCSLFVRVSFHAGHACVVREDIVIPCLVFLIVDRDFLRGFYLDCESKLQSSTFVKL